ncbi:hypothetical protein [Thalassovita sp.]|uniref:hypothetical protein n=1 Tax=Thalassovita sp. TaxID=1979401 RepID=UPI0029DE76C3|nr:hypothetical protein [Thalassovita sp.]
MYHAMNPYLFSTSMFRMATWVWEAQIECLNVSLKLASVANPMFLPREIVLCTPPAKPATPDRAPRRKAAPVETTTEVEAKPVVKDSVKPVVAEVAKPVVENSAEPGTAEAGKPAVAVSAKSAASVSPKPVSEGSAQSVTKDVMSAGPKKPRAPSKPPIMPERKYDA